MDNLITGFWAAIHPYWGVLSICGTIICSIGGALWRLVEMLNKYVTNHFAHYEAAIEDKMDAVADRIIIAILQNKN